MRNWIAVSVAVVGLAVFGPASRARAQQAPDRSLRGMIPSDALLVVERRGHDAVAPHMAETNFGRAWNDEPFMNMLTGMLEIGLAEIGRDEQQAEDLRTVLTPFWHSPGALFVSIDPNEDEQAGGVMVLADRRVNEAAGALDRMFQHTIDSPHSFEDVVAVDIEIDGVPWTGLARKYGQNVQLPADAGRSVESLREMHKVMLVHTEGPLLAIAFDVGAAERLSQTLRGADPGLAELPEAPARALEHAAMDGWAMRWFVDVERLLSAMDEQLTRLEQETGGAVRAYGFLAVIQSLQVQAVGGTIGYADGVSTGRTAFLTAGEIDALPADGSYEAALELLPRRSAACMLAQLDTAALSNWFGQMVQQLSAEYGEPGPQESGMIDAGRALAEACDGRVAVFMTDPQSLVGGGVPVAAATGLADADQARATLARLLPETNGEPETYRGVEIRRIGAHPPVFLAIGDDRLYFGGLSAVKSAIDAAHSDRPALGADHAARDLLDAAGPGQAMIMIDTPALIELGWPMLLGMAQQGQTPLDPATLPSTNYMLDTVGPETGVLRRIEGGMLLETRGFIPGGVAAPMILAPARWSGF